MTQYTTSGDQTHARSDCDTWHLRDDRSPYTRAWRRWVLGHAVLPARVSTPRGGVSRAALVAVLTVVDDHAGTSTTARLRHSTIAQETGLSVAQVRRALAAAEAEYLVDVGRRRAGSVRLACDYSIAWTNIWELVSPSVQPRAPRTRRSTDAPAQPDRPVTDSGPQCHGDTTPLSPRHHPTVTMTVPYCHGDTTYNHPQNQISQPPPPPPDEATVDVDPAWVAVAADLRSVLPAAWRRALDAARRRGWRPGAVRRVVATYRVLADHPDVRSAGYVLHVVEAADPTSAPEGVWPVPPPEVRRLVDRAYTRRAQAMSPDDVRDLLARCAAQRPEVRPLCELAERLGWDPQRPELRYHLVDALRYLDRVHHAEEDSP